MGRYAPFATLAAVAALGGALFVVNTVNNPANTPLGGPAAVEQGPGDPAAPPLLAAPAAPAAPGAPAPAPGAPPVPEPPAVDEQSYTGHSAGDEMSVAVAVKDGRAVGYVCDGKTIEAWFEGTLTGDQLDLRGGDGRNRLTGTVTPTATLGSVTVGKKTYPFSAAGAPAPAGLYEGNASVRGVTARLGWIVGADGSVTGVATMDGRRGPAPALDPADPYAVEVDGVPVAVSAIDGGDAVIRR